MLRSRRSQQSYLTCNTFTSTNMKYIKNVDSDHKPLESIVKKSLLNDFNECCPGYIFARVFGPLCSPQTQLLINDNNFTFQIKKKSNSRLQVSYEFSDEDKEQDLDIEALLQLWETFHDLMESLRSLPGTSAFKNEETFQKEAMEQASNFRKQTFDEDVITFIHGKSILMILCIAKKTVSLYFIIMQLYNTTIFF